MILKNMFCNEENFSRFTNMLDDAQTKNLFNSRIIVFGVGGVGGSVVKMLVRSGIQHLTIVDFDKIDATNINRQVVANSQNIGQFKVDELKKQIKEINPNIDVQSFNTKLSEETIEMFNLKTFDYIVDCIDDIPAKQILIKYASKNKIPIICAMGAGNRYLGIPAFEIADIKQTSYDPIAKIIRKFCANEGINKLTVCYTKQKTTKFDCKTIGSVIYYTMNMATIMVAKVINDIIKG